MAVITALRQDLGTGSIPKTFQGYKAHFDNQSLNSVRLAILETLRENYPDHHISCVNAEDFDLLEYSKSKSSKASLTLASSQSNTSSIDLCENVFKYTAPVRRLNNDPGSIENNHIFVPYALCWNNQNIPVFHTQWHGVNKWDTVEYWFLCVPRESGYLNDDGQHSFTSDIILDVGEWTSELHDEIYVFDNSRWRKSKSLYQSVKGSSWDDVIMDPKLKNNLIDDVQGFFNSQNLYSKFKVPWKRGIIMHGVPGNGKTCSIKALVNYLAALPKPVPSLYVKTLDNKCNMPQWEVASIFKKARSIAPCLLILEDLDSLVGEKVRSYFLNEVDGLESNDGILMLGSTNHLNRLDPAISKRPSRFDRKYHFRVPDRAQRIAYGEYWQQKLTNTKDIDFPVEICPLIADLTDTFSFAYMKELFVVSLLTVARGGVGEEEPNDWEEVSEPIPTPTESTEGDASDNDEDSDEEETDCKKCKKAAAKKRKEKAKKAKKDKEKKIREVPTVEVPEELKGNVLFKVMQQQIKLLVHEMDNTDEEEKPRGLMAGGRSGSDDEGGCSDC